MASLVLETLDNPPQPPGDGGTMALPSPLQQGKPLPVAGSSSKTAIVGSSSQDFLLPPPLPTIPPLPSPTFNQAAPPATPTRVVYSLSGSTATSSPPRLVQTLPGSFPDIYDGDMKKWDEHFHSIQRAYKEFGKEDDFAIRVLTEDFTLPFPFAWPSETEVGRQPAYDPSDCAGFDFFLHPGQPVPRLLQPLHATTQAFFKKRRLEQLALSYASKASLANTPGLPSPQESSPGLRPDIMVITTMPCVATTTTPSEPPFILQDGKAPRNIQPAPATIPNVAPRQSINLQFMSPTNHGPF
ncbi:uncharacterized protein LOC121915510 [Sceloporus undulatus]|uniref:uncharacterized protein LOC121915510 n=1 Tax=Sceloporus undulatus TaxID=8520 RepID=UPI001C4CB28D|nr:uncharacterized protein LOC121915510 [Sceloporus undulatus]